MSTAPTPKRSEIWLIRFDPAVGAEIRKLRPAVIVGLNSIGLLPLRLVVPITDWKASFATCPWFVKLPPTSTNGLLKTSGADAFQTKSISLDRFVRKLGDVSPTEIDAIAEAIAMCVGSP